MCLEGKYLGLIKEGKEQDEYVSKFCEFDVSCILRISIPARNFC